jgi:hypothetical protein
VRSLCRVALAVARFGQARVAVTAERTVFPARVRVVVPTTVVTPPPLEGSVPREPA